MSTAVKMPQLGESVVEGAIVRWLKAPGDYVAKYEPLLEISTDKIDTEVPSPAEGILLEILAPEGQTVAVGTVLATIGQRNEKSAPVAPAPAVTTQRREAPAMRSPSHPLTQSPCPPNQPAAPSSAPSWRALPINTRSIWNRWPAVGWVGGLPRRIFWPLSRSKHNNWSHKQLANQLTSQPINHR